MAGKRSKRSKNKGNRPEHPAIRAFFYVSFIIVLVLTVYFFYLNATGKLGVIDTANYTAVTLSFIFSTAVISYLLLKGKRLGDIVESLGMSKRAFTGKIVMIGIILFFLLFLFEVIITFLSALSGVALPTNANVFEATAPLAVLLFAIFISPLNEEVFFRGFLVPRYGIFLPAILFAILHAGYASITEFVGAFTFGLLSGYVFQKTRSLYPSIIAHMLVNALAVVVFILAGG